MDETTKQQETRRGPRRNQRSTKNSESKQQDNHALAPQTTSIHRAVWNGAGAAVPGHESWPTDSWAMARASGAEAKRLFPVVHGGRPHCGLHRLWPSPQPNNTPPRSEPQTRVVSHGGSHRVTHTTLSQPHSSWRAGSDYCDHRCASHPHRVIDAVKETRHGLW